MTDAPPPKPNYILIALPVILFAALALLFWKGLFGDPETIPSALIGRPAPQVTLPAIEGSGFPLFTSADLKGGGVSVVNIWASWCAPCREEHPLLLELAKRKDIHLYGINYKDDAENARRFLGTLGNPFAAIVGDVNGRAAVDWGVYGVPETYVIDGQGVIRFKQIGPLSPGELTGSFAAEIEKAKTPLKQD